MTHLEGSVKSIIIRDTLKLFIEIPILDELSEKEKLELKSRIHCGPVVLNQGGKSFKGEITSIMSLNGGKIISAAAELGKSHAHAFSLGKIALEYVNPE